MLIVAFSYLSAKVKPVENGVLRLQSNLFRSNPLHDAAKYSSLRKHKTHCKPKMPCVPNLLEQFVLL